MARCCSSAKAMAAVVMLCMPTLLSAGRIGVSVERSQATLTTESSGDVGECGYVDNCKECFDKLRSEQCTKKDVCLLMRQLDAFFYERARNGTLVNYESPPQRSWLSRGRCARNRRSIKMKPVFSKKLCKSAARREGVRGDVKLVSDASLPSGCVLKNRKAYLNEIETSVEAGITYVKTSDKPWATSKRTQLEQYCEVDHALEEASAYYYSPYKLKQNMRERPQMSTTCSFGMMAHLHNLGLTASPCAKILAYRPSMQFYSAADALKAAATAPAAKAAEIRAQVEAIRQKFVLIEQVTNHWCPDTWTEAMATPGSTCSAPRFPTWASHGFAVDATGEAERAAYLLDGIGGETKSDLSASRTPKIGLMEAACSAMEDETLDSVLAGVDETPPDFFRDAMLGED